MQSGSTKGNKYPPGYAGGIFVSTFYQAVALSLFASGLREFQSEGAEAVEAVGERVEVVVAVAGKTATTHTRCSLQSPAP